MSYNVLTCCRHIAGIDLSVSVQSIVQLSVPSRRAGNVICVTISIEFLSWNFTGKLGLKFRILAMLGLVSVLLSHRLFNMQPISHFLDPRCLYTVDAKLFLGRLMFCDKNDFSFLSVLCQIIIIICTLLCNYCTFSSSCVSSLSSVWIWML